MVPIWKWWFPIVALNNYQRVTKYTYMIFPLTSNVLYLWRCFPFENGGSFQFVMLISSQVASPCDAGNPAQWGVAGKKSTMIIQWMDSQWIILDYCGIILDYTGLYWIIMRLYWINGINLWWCQNSNWKWLFILDLLIENGGSFHSYVKLPEMIIQLMIIVVIIQF